MMQRDGVVMKLVVMRLATVIIDALRRYDLDHYENQRLYRPEQKRHNRYQTSLPEGE